MVGQLFRLHEPVEKGTKFLERNPPLFVIVEEMLTRVKLEGIFSSPSFLSVHFEPGEE